MSPPNIFRVEDWVGEGVGDGGGGGVQVHVILRGPATFALLVKVKVSAWHGIFEMETCCDAPGVSVVPGGEKLTPPRLSFADQVILVLEPESSVRVTVQV